MPAVRLSTTSTPEARIRSTTSAYSSVSRAPLPVSGSRTWMCTTAAPAFAAVDRRVGDLLGRDRHVRALADGVAGAGDGTGDEDVPVHRSLPSSRSRERVSVFQAPDGYKRCGTRWLHPDSTTGEAGVIQFPDGCLFAHGGGALADGTSHDPFDCFRLLEHRGDVSCAVRGAAAILGIEPTPSRREFPPLEIYAEDLDMSVAKSGAHLTLIQGAAAQDGAEDVSEVRPQSVTLRDFYAYMPMHAYIFAPNGDMWPGSSVDARIAMTKGKASGWLDNNNPVEQMTWSPGEPQIIEGRLVSNGGWFARPGCRCFNLYRPPTIAPGNAVDVVPWLTHLKKIFPNDAVGLPRRN